VLFGMVLVLADMEVDNEVVWDIYVKSRLLFGHCNGCSDVDVLGILLGDDG